MSWLTDRQLIALTRRRQPAAQIRVLKEAGIAHRVVDGRPVVMAADVALEAGAGALDLSTAHCA